MPDSIPVYITSDNNRQYEAMELVEKLHLPFLNTQQEDFCLNLVQGQNKTEILDLATGLSIQVSFTRGALAYRLIQVQGQPRFYPPGGQSVEPER